MGNHGPLGIDSPLLIKGIWEQRQRIARGLADRLLFRMPLVRLMVGNAGAVEGEPAQATRLLRAGELLLVYPGGSREAVRPPDRKYQLSWRGRTGFIRVALAAGVPIIPVACIGADDAYIQLADSARVRKTRFGGWLAARFGEHYVPPIYAGFGPLPLPTKFDYYFGEPIHLGTDACPGDSAVAAGQARVQMALEGLLAYGLDQREGARSLPGADDAPAPANQRRAA